ncbi:MAG: hypothetical protein DMF61_01170 [Blastocatellia bacterium AA13]|nr:MAG: hypothetical protein DMF61_01170 [Blastocatellia bacterium AA13]
MAPLCFWMMLARGLQKREKLSSRHVHNPSDPYLSSIDVTPNPRNSNRNTIHIDNPILTIIKGSSQDRACW